MYSFSLVFSWREIRSSCVASAYLVKSWVCVRPDFINLEAEAAIGDSLLTAASDDSGTGNSAPISQYHLSTMKQARIST